MRHEKTLKNLKKLLKNPLTKRTVCGIIYGRLEKGCRNHTKSLLEKLIRKNFEKIKKLSKKYLTNEKKCGIIYKLSTETRTSKSIIEN